MEVSVFSDSMWICYILYSLNKLMLLNVYNLLYSYLPGTGESAKRRAERLQKGVATSACDSDTRTTRSRPQTKRYGDPEDESEKESK